MYLICVSYSCFLCYCRFLFFFFFFQAEDGIRDTSVTGVQTCALPSSARRSRRRPPRRRLRRRSGRLTARSLRGPEIGRASCRERVEISVGAGSLKKKKKKAVGERASKGERRKRRNSEEDEK